jgi:RHS repeat-associated protein
MERQLSLGLLALTAGVLATTSARSSSVGRVAGDFNVSATGSAQYSIPIWTPPGPRGVQPHLAINYDSQSGTGSLGPGWQLSGLSAIYRCNLTVAQDGAAAAVTLTVSDRYCLDGKRLRLTSGENLNLYGESTSTYQTEIADFTSISSSGTTGSGPTYLTGQGKDGLTYEYGNVNTTGAPSNGSQILAPGSATAYEWLLDKVSDRDGNNYVITYSAPNAATGVGLPTTIAFTPTAQGATTYSYTVTFVYGTRVAQNPSTHTPSISGSVAGSSTTNPNLLNSITVKYGTTILRVYNLGYTASTTTAQALLTSITECGGSAGTDCLPATNIAYQPGASGIPTPSVTVATGTLKVIATRDFNGDGRDDILYLNTSNNTLYVAFAAAGGFSTPVSVGVTGNPSALCYGDVLGIGQSDLLVPISNVFWRYTWNGTSFVGTNTGIVLDTGVTWAALIDINGDGLADLVTAYLGNPPTVYSRLNKSSAGALSFDTTESSYTVFNPCGVGNTCTSTVDADGGLVSMLRSLDFNGDGLADIVINTSAYNGGVLQAVSHTLMISTGTSFYPGAAYGGNSPYVYLNANNDACTDFASGTTIVFSACNGANWSFVTTTGNAIGALDWDGDGVDDVLVVSGSNFGVIESTGSGGTAIIPTGTTYNANAFFVFDADGDGLADLGTNAHLVGGNIQYATHNGAGQPPDLMSSVKDGYGNSASPAYKSLVGASNYSKSSDAVYPYENYVGALYAVSTATFSDPSNMPSGTYTKSFIYNGAWLNLQGRGFQSFYSQKVTDSRTSLTHEQDFERQFPYNGMQFQDIIANSSHYIIETTAIPATTTLDNTANNQRYFPYFSVVNSNQKELGGAEDGTLITTTATTYTYDNYGNATTVNTVMTDTDPGVSPNLNPYNGKTWTSDTINTIAPSTSTWCLTLPTETQVTKSSTAPGGAAITRTVTYTPDYTKCRQNEQVVEPASPIYKVTTDYLYDLFGNPKSQKVTGVGMTARTSLVDWGTTGQFPKTVTNALSQVTQYGFDPDTGVKLSAQDPNGITTSWQYDSFNRPIHQSNPDGTSVTWAYNPCATAGCVNANNVMTVVKTHVNIDGTTLRIDNTYLDTVDRTLVTSGQMLGGAYDRNEVQYDNMGRVHLQGLPCTFVSCVQYWTTNTLDDLNRLTQSQRPISSSNSTLQSTTYAYQGRTSIVTDAQNKTRTTITKVTGGVGRTKDHNGYYVNFSHDAFGSVLSVTDSLSNTLSSVPSYSYGLRAFPPSSTDMDLGARTYTFDALGELTAYTDAKGQNFSMIYDALSRPTSRAEGTDLTTTWTWGTSAAAFNIGKLASFSSTELPLSQTYTENYGFDSAGRLTSKAIVMPTAGTKTFNYVYSTSNALLQFIDYPASYPSTYRLRVGYYYSYGNLIELYDGQLPSTLWWQAKASNPRGQVTKEITEDLSGDPQVVSNRAYDAVTGWLGSTQTGIGGGATLQNESYAYDEVGNVIQRQNNNAGLTENFYYDNLYRLDHSTLGASTNLQMCYDNTGGACAANLAGMGNISSRSDIASGAAWTYDPVRKHAVTQAGDASHTYSYDANGNANARNGTTIGWTSFNYPNSVATSTESATFDYGPAHQRWRMIYSGPSGTETTYYATPMFEQVATSAGSDYRHYLYAGGRPVMVISRTTAGAVTARSLLLDHQGSISSIVTDSTGTSYVSENFTAYGNRREASTWSGAPTTGERTSMDGVTREGYTFQTVLGSMGLNHMNGRVEDSITGRFLSADPNISDPGNTQTYNRYTYVGNNPLTFTDPTGFSQTSLKCLDSCGLPSGLALASPRVLSKLGFITQLNSNASVTPRSYSIDGAGDFSVNDATFASLDDNIGSFAFTGYQASNGNNGASTQGQAASGQTSGTAHGTGYTLGCDAQGSICSDPSLNTIPYYPQSTASSSSWWLPSQSFNFSEWYSAFNPKMYVNTAWETVTKVVGTSLVRLASPGIAVNVSKFFSGVAVFSIPLFEASTAADAENDFFYGGFGVPGAVDNLPQNLPGPYGNGVSMGGGVYWVPDYYGQQ